MAMKKKELQAAYDKLKEENEELKEENEELQDKITCLESDSYNEISMAEYEDMKQNYEEQIAKLKENSPKPSVIKELEAQVTALKAANKELVDELECRKSHTDSQIAELKEQYKKLLADYQDIFHDGPCLESENTKLKAEYDELKTEIVAFHSIKSNDEIVLGQTYPPGLVGMKTLVEAWRYYMDEHIADAVELIALNEEITTLKAEIKELKKPKSYRDFQKKCKELGLTATGKLEVLQQRIQEHETKTPEVFAEQAEEAWIEQYLSDLGSEFRDADGEYRYYIIGGRDSLQDQMESDMVMASQKYAETHGVGFPSIDDDMNIHEDVGALADHLEEWFQKHGATDEDIKNMYPED